MSMFELEHPLGQDLERIHEAVSLGFVAEAIKRKVRETEDLPRIKVSYKPPSEYGGTIEGIRVADWITDNMTAIYYPFAVDAADKDWQILTDEGLFPVVQRVHTRDILGRGFPVTVAGEEFITPYLQFDVLEQGVALVCEDNGEQVVGMGLAATNAYEGIADLARHQSSIAAILKLAEEA